MATTKTQSFNNKIKALRDFHSRLISGVGGIPSSSDIQAALKYFCVTLKSILKETPSIPNESYGARLKDVTLRINLFPNFHYNELFYILIGLCEFICKLNNQSSVCEAVLKTFNVLIPFLEFDNLDMLPLIVTSCINFFPSSQHPAIIELLCTTVIPFVYTWNEECESYAIESIPAILQIIFQHIDKSEYHSWVVESFMSKKRDLWKDLLLLIAYGSIESRLPATYLLFYYWPDLCPVQFQSSQARFPTKYHHEAWKAILCERTDCPNKASKTVALKMTYDPQHALMFGNKMPPLYVCLDCFDALSRQRIVNLHDAILPIKKVKTTCESKTCRSKNNNAYITCFSAECTCLNGHKPIRFCEGCHIQKHLGAQSKKHIYQLPLPDIWDCNMEIKPCMVEAIVSLSKETLPRWRQQLGTTEEALNNLETGGGTKSNLDQGSPSMLGVIKSFASFQDNDIPLSGKYSDDDHKIISLYAAFIIGEKCPPKPNTNIEILSRIVSGLFNWFYDTVFTVCGGFGPDSLDEFIEKIKKDYLLKWIQQVVENNLEVMLTVLLPYPIEYAKVGSCWDSLCDRTAQVKQGLHKISSLIPYDIITFETWDYIIPFWLETLRTEIPESDYPELEVLMKKIFDPHAGPFPFLPAKLYQFATQRFTNTSIAVQDQILCWLDILTRMKVQIPMKELLTMFSVGIKSMHDPIPLVDVIYSETSRPSLIHQEESLSISGSDSGPPNVNQSGLSQLDDMDPDGALTGAMSGTISLSNSESFSMVSCLCMMLKTISVQLKMNDPHGHGNMSQQTPTLTLGLLTDMLLLCWSTENCKCKHFAESSIPPTQNTRPSSVGDAAAQENCPTCQNALIWHQLASDILHHIVPLNPISLPDSNLTIESISSINKNKPGSTKTSTTAPQTVKENKSDDKAKVESAETESENKEFDISDLSVDLKLLYLLVKELRLNHTDPEIIRSILMSITYLIRHAELLKTDQNSTEKKLKYINHLIENMLIPALWDLMCSEFSYLAELSVPLLLYCFTISSGADQFWQILEKEFTSTDWRVRFDAVEKLTILARQVEDSMFGENQAVMTSLAHAFSNLIGSLDDLNSAVATRTIFYLESIKDKSLSCIVKCLEFQFDSVIADRTLILLRIYQLSWALPGRSVFSWDFFINRFGIFSIEAQIGNNLETDINNVTDLNNQKGVTDLFRMQFERARLAVARTDSIRSISLSTSSNPLYRRACSVPMHQNSAVNLSNLHTAVQPLHLGITNKAGFKLNQSHDSKNREDSGDKFYARQSSAPQFSLGRRKSKPLLPGLGGLNVAEYTDPNNRFLTNIQEALDLEGSSRDTLHQWVMLLLKFMASVDMQVSKDELKDKKALSKVQRHLALLLGYTDQSFNIPPYKLRNSTVFHAFISNVAKVLDCNFSMGNSILHQTLVVLQFCASPQRYASDSQPPTFSLWLLEPQTRIHWLNVLLVVLYKYEYNASGAGSGVVGGFRAIVDYLVRIAINTVENHLHVCKRMDEGYSPPTPHMPRPRDTSNFSMDIEPIVENDVPQSPNGNFSDSLNITRSSRSTTVHYTKKDKELEMLNSRFTSPVIKKKVARQYRGRSSATNTLNSSGISGNNNNVVEEEMVPLTTQPDSDTPSTAYDNPVKEIILSPITVSSKDKTIKTSPSNLEPVIEEGGDPKEENTQNALLSNVENKMAEQLSQFFMEIDNNKRPGSILLSDSSTLKETSIVEDKEKSEDEIDSFDDKPNYRQRKARKSGLTSVEIQKILDTKDDPGRRRPRRSEFPTTDTGLNSTVGSSSSGTKQSFYHRHVESFMVERCNKCHAVLEHYDEETLGLAIVCFGAYVHREPALAAPYLYDMLVVSAKIASHNLYSWKNNLHNVVIPNNVVSCARQFLRCTFYNLFPNGLFVQLFQTEIENNDSFMKCLVSVLIDFEDHLNLFQPVQQVLEGLNKKKVISSENLPIVIDNLAAYLESLPTSIEDSKVTHMLNTWWSNIAPQFDIFLRKLPNNLQPDTDVGPILRIIIIMIRSNMTSSCKSLMDTFAFLLKFIVETCIFSLPPILELCSMTNRLCKEKGKNLLTKCLVEELHLAIKFKIYVPDKNLLLLIQFVLMDAGGTVEPNKICEGLTNLFNPATYHILNTGAAELMRAHLHDCISFLSDVHTVHKVKQNQKLSGSQSLHEDTLGSHLKSAIAQYVALELSPSSSSRVTYSVISMAGADSKDSPILQFMPWIKSIPPATQQGTSDPREFILCVERVRTLNWLLLGTMIHTCVTSNSTGITCQPIPLGFKKSIADLVKVILSGFPDQQKQSVIVMSSLYHAFVLCQLWTMYCETAANLHSMNSMQYQEAVKTAMDFWMNILPTILHLLTISDDFVVVNGHLLTIMEELIECRSQTVAKVITLWTPILQGRNKQLPGNLQKRLQKCVEWEPPESETLASSNGVFIKWLKKHVFVLGRNEDQHSAATHIFVQ